MGLRTMTDYSPFQVLEVLIQCFMRPLKVLLIMDYPSHFVE